VISSSENAENIQILRSEHGHSVREVPAALPTCSFVRLISHRPSIYFSQNKPATSQQYFSLRTNQHQQSATSQTNRPVDYFQDEVN
jgi:hypothetical protein